MKLGLFLGIGAALFLHAAFLLFGGLIFHAPKAGEGSLQQVELVSEDEAATEDKKKEDEPPPETTEEELKTEEEQAPDAEELIRHMELSAASRAPELEAASLGAIEAALSGQAGGSGDFAQSLDFASGGRIGGHGKAGGMKDALDDAFSLDELDQKPRVIVQTMPNYPASMRGKKLEAVVNVVFIVDQTGKVVSPRVEKSSNAAFDKPALDAVKNWKFEPAVKAGQRVPCKMRAPLRFRPS